jgi:Bacterial SH3 domain
MLTTMKQLARGRLAWALLLMVALLPAALGGGSTHASAEYANGPIASAALKYLDSHGGQCWTFMREVVFDATGRTVGFDYREGFFEAGAVEVSAKDAANGDIIQIAADWDTSPGASYAGLHTAIILQNNGDGTFDAIDSNQNWDEWVALRNGYDPYAAAGRYGLQVHIYRIPGGSKQEAVAAASTTLSDGAAAVVATGSGCLNLRAEPSVAAAKIDCLADGTSVTVFGGAVTADGFEWLHVASRSGNGWMAARYLAAAPPAAEEAPAEAAGTAAAAATVAIAAHVDPSPGCLYVRSGPAVDAEPVACEDPGAPILIINDAGVSDRGYTWVGVRTPAGIEGWSANEYIVRD